MSALNEITACEVCGGSLLEPVLDLGLHPLCDDLVPVGDGRVCREYPIEILYCRRCTTAHQRFQVPKRELFPRSYHYRSRFTADVLSGMDAFVASCNARLAGVAGKSVVDVGCNDGSLLERFRKLGAATVGVEPTDAYLDAAEKGHRLYNAFFNEQTARAIVESEGRPEIITFTNVFAHIEDLQGLIAALRLLMSESTTVVVENHYLGAVLERSQFDTFYHEHPRTYSLNSFTWIARALGRKLTGVEFPSRYGGNIRVFMGSALITGADQRALDDRLSHEHAFTEQLVSLQRRVEQWQRMMSRRIAALVERHGPLSAKAFPGRAAILVKLLGLSTKEVAEVFEKPGSMKIDHYVPGTRIPIKSDDELFARKTGPAVLLNLAWHIGDEIRRYLVGHGFRGEVIDILDPHVVSTQG
ncbi:MAG TPA: class I SAM-dependent methyltransferase [Casimicrobiaceae bacterium]|nr:class I SAM-dependent methyltransferase [Casimicrobiaceae bacterium]